MLGQLYVTLELDLSDDILKYLPVSQLPEGHRQHNEGYPLHNIQSQHGHLLVEGRWLPIVVADEELLVDVENEEGNAGDTVERRHGTAIGEGHADLKQDG